jgi:hypothetical protein
MNAGILQVARARVSEEKHGRDGNRVSDLHVGDAR